MISIILLVVALVCFIAAAANAWSDRVSLGWLGAAFVVLSMLLGGVKLP